MADTRLEWYRHKRRTSELVDFCGAHDEKEQEENETGKTA
jgi:hypothetical protein